MKRIIRNLSIAFIALIFCSFLFLKSEKVIDAKCNYQIIGVDGLVYNYITSPAGNGAFWSMPDPNNPGGLARSIQANLAVKNASGGAIPSPNGTYYEPGSSKPSAAAPTASPKAEPKKEEAKCEHEYTSEVTTEPTCKDKGVMTFTCSKCGDTYTEEIDVTDEHDFVEETVKEPTCTEDGEVKKVCSICEYEETSEIPKLEHSYKEEITKEATCTENGVKTFTCELCGDTHTEDIKATGHNEGQFEITKPNGMFTDGEQIKKCTVCDEVLETEVIKAKYPIWYLYCGIGILVVIISVIIGVVIKKKK